MSLHSDSNVEMSCADFGERFDGYVDGLLGDADSAACQRHVAMCRNCDREVVRWQQARILLSTAVADFATAVDLSSLRSDVEAALGFDAAERPSKRRAVDREAAYDRAAAVRTAGREGGRRSDRGREAGLASRRRSFAATLRFVSAAAVSAATAAAAVLLMTPAAGPTTTVVASAPAVSSPAASSSSFAYQPASLRGASRRGMADVAPVAYVPPPLAKPQVSHVDGIEAAPGRQVSTWVQPRTNARVIWVQDRGTGAPVRTAGLDR